MNKIIKYLILGVVPWVFNFAVIYVLSGVFDWQLFVIYALATSLVLYFCLPPFMKILKEAPTGRRWQAVATGLSMLMCLAAITYYDLVVLGREFSETRIYIFTAISGVFGLLVNWLFRKLVPKP